MDAQDRKMILQEARNLKGSRFGDIYVHRDLTYSQRQELRNRRQSQRVSTERPPASVTTSEASAAGASLN